MQSTSAEDDPLWICLNERFPRLAHVRDVDRLDQLPTDWNLLVVGLFQALDDVLTDAEAASVMTISMKEKLGRFRIFVRASSDRPLSEATRDRVQQLIREASARFESRSRRRGP